MLTKRTKTIIFIILVSFLNAKAFADDMGLVGTWTYKGIGCVGTDTLPSSLPESEFYPYVYNDRIIFNSDNTLVEEGFNFIYRPYICPKTNIKWEYTLVNGNSLQKKNADFQIYKETCVTLSDEESLKSEDLDKLDSLIDAAKKIAKFLVDDSYFEISGDTLYLTLRPNYRICKDRFIAAYTRLK